MAEIRLRITELKEQRGMMGPGITVTAEDELSRDTFTFGASFMDALRIGDIIQVEWRKEDG